LPSRRASESPIAIACLRLLTVPPLPPLPLFNVPRLNLCISRSTSFDALRAYLLAMAILLSKLIQLPSARAFEILYCALVLLGGRARLEGAEISTPAGFGINLSRVQAILA